MTETPLMLARRFAARVRERNGIDMTHGGDIDRPIVKNRKETKAHGYMPDALASVVFEGGEPDLLEVLGEGGWVTPNYFIDAYASYLVGVFPR